MRQRVVSGYQVLIFKHQVEESLSGNVMLSFSFDPELIQVQVALRA